jgi:adenylosuccinate lyase
MASEDILLAAAARGVDRQEAHEAIRRHSMEAGRRVKDEGAPNDLLDRLRRDPMFAGLDWGKVTDPAAYVGRAPAQVDRFVAEVVEPVRRRYAEAIREEATLEV